MVYPDEKYAVERAVRAVLDELAAELNGPAPAAALSLEDALRMGRGAYAEALTLGVAVVFCVVDAGGTPLALHRMDGAFLGSVLLAQKKAYTAAAFNRPTHEIHDSCGPGGELYGIQHGSNITVVGGGFPCFRGNTLVGGLGISGGTVAQDMRIASKALELL